MKVVISEAAKELAQETFRLREFRVEICDAMCYDEDLDDDEICLGVRELHGELEGEQELVEQIRDLKEGMKKIQEEKDGVWRVFETATRKLQRKKDDFEESCCNLEDEKEQLQEENEELQEGNRSLQEERKKLQEKNKKLNEENKNLKIQVEVARAIAREAVGLVMAEPMPVEKQLEELKKENKKQLEELQKENKKLQIQLDDLVSEPCWPPGCEFCDKSATIKTIIGDEYAEWCCVDCNKVRRPDQYPCGDPRINGYRCEECPHCMRTRVCDKCGCVGGCYDHCFYLTGEEPADKPK